MRIRMDSWPFGKQNGNKKIEVKFWVNKQKWMGIRIPVYTMLILEHIVQGISFVQAAPRDPGNNAQANSKTAPADPALSSGLGL